MQPIAAEEATFGPVVPAWILSALLLASVTISAPVLGGNARWIFIVGCAGVGVHAWLQGSASHLQASLVLFCFASLLRRIVDLRAGFDPSGLMLVGPLIAISAPIITLAAGSQSALRSNRVLPIVLVTICVFYATFLTIFQGE